VARVSGALSGCVILGARGVKNWKGEEENAGREERGDWGRGE
jgi:hypothetical protein